jgi:GT2 family glycosyltransferase
MAPPTATGKLAIIIPVFNTREQVLSALRHLRSLPDCALVDVIVVDDGSTDGTASAIAAEFPEVTVLHGTGQLYWTGGIRRGMEHALAAGAEWMVWLNHDCRPEPGTIRKLVDALHQPDVGCVSGLRYLRGQPTAILSPGFDHRRRPLTVKQDCGFVEAGGTNGNCVAFRADVVRHVGLPDARKFPHYGDGPYTLQVRRAGYRVLIHTGAKVAQDHDVVRNLSPFWRVALTGTPSGGWLRYFFCSPKSFYEWRFRWHRMRLFRSAAAWILYPAGFCWLLGAIAAGTASRHWLPRNWLLKRCLQQLPARIPPQQLVMELSRA